MNIRTFKSKNIQYEISNSWNKKSRTSSPAENQDKKTAKFESFPAAEKPCTRPTPPSTHPFCTHCYRTHTHTKPRQLSFTHTHLAHTQITHLHAVFTGGAVVDGWCDFYRAGLRNGSFSTSTTSRTHTTAFSRRHISGVTSGKILITRSGFCARRVGNEAWRFRGKSPDSGCGFIEWLCLSSFLLLHWYFFGLID